MLVTAIGRGNGNMSETDEHCVASALQALPMQIEHTGLDSWINKLKLWPTVCQQATQSVLGRGDQYPIAMEGALKLKEISYIHAEAYAAGELKHGPLALIDSEMPIIVVAPNNELAGKLKSNVEEVRARGGLLYVFADRAAGFTSDDTMRVMPMESVADIIAPIVHHSDAITGLSHCADQGHRCGSTTKSSQISDS